jgi:hypothetical protein
MQFVQSLLHRLPQPLVDRLMAWRVLYPTTPLTDLPPAVKKEVTQILTSTLPEHPPAAAPPPRPANNGQRTPQLPPHVVERLKELQRSYPHPQRPVALPPPAILPTVIGTDSTTGEDVRITQTVQGTYIVGANGTGKTNIVKTLAVSAIQNGLGLCIVEPHGDLTYDILGAVPRHRQNDIVFIDVEEFEHPFGLNLFEVPEPISIRTQAQVASFVSHTFEVLWNAGFETPRLMQNLRAVTRTLIANPGSTFGDITLLYTSEETRARLLANVRNPQVLAYWEEYERLNFRDRRLLTESFLNKVSAFLDEPMICNILSQPKTTINFRSIMDNSKILLIKLSPQFEEASKLIGAIVIGKLLMTAFSRADVPPERRLPFHLYVDEFQRFQSSDFATFIAEARKFNISTFLSHQTLMQLTEQNRASALAAGTIICFRVSGDDSRVLSRSFDTTPTQQIVGEEPVRAPVADVIGHLVRRGHTNTVLTEFTTRYLKPLEADIQRWGHTQSVFLFGCAECRGGDLVEARRLINNALFEAQETGRADGFVHPQALFFLVGQINTRGTYVFFDHLTRGFIETAEFLGLEPSANVFGRGDFLENKEAIDRLLSTHDTRGFFGVLRNRPLNAPVATAFLRMLRDLRAALAVLSKEPIMVDTGAYAPKYQMRTYADMEGKISNYLANQENYTAKVKIVSSGEYTIKTRPAPQSLTGSALAERIEAVKRHCRALGLTRHYTEVIEELQKRTEYLRGLGAPPDEPASDEGDEPDEPPDTGFSLD